MQRSFYAACFLKVLSWCHDGDVTPAFVMVRKKNGGEIEGRGCVGFACLTLFDVDQQFA